MAEPAKTPSPVPAPRLVKVEDDDSLDSLTPVSKTKPTSTEIPHGVDTLTKLLDSLREADGLRERVDQLRYQLVILPEGYAPSVETFSGLESLIGRIKTLGQQGTRFLTLYGEVWGVTKGRFKYLISPSGERFPLFDDSPKLVVDPFGSLSEDDDPEPEDALEPEPSQT